MFLNSESILSAARGLGEMTGVRRVGVWGGHAVVFEGRE